jgi:hypothetical protein
MPVYIPYFKCVWLFVCDFVSFLLISFSIIGVVKHSIVVRSFI